jgi:hypothetical protein
MLRQGQKDASMHYVIQDLTGSDTCDEKHVGSDIYCAERHTARVSFSLPLIATVVGTGVVAVLLAGFVGYFNCLPAYSAVLAQPTLTLRCPGDFWSTTHFLYLNEPWPLYLWLSGLMLLLQFTILRHRLRSLIAMLVITVVSIAIVAVVYLLGVDALRRYTVEPPDGLIYQPWAYTVLNFGIIGAFLLDSARRWIGYRHNELSAASMEALMRADPSRSMHVRRAKMGELISGDLIAGMILCAILSIAFSPWFMRGVLALAGSNEFNCGGVTTVTTPCPVPGPHNALLVQGPIPLLANHFIYQIDTFLAGICFVPGIAVLANTAFLRGLTPLSGSGSSMARGAIEGGSTGDVTAQVGMAILDSLREAIQRYILPYARRTMLSLRNIFWPLLVLIASFSLALCARYVQYYLHHYDPTYGCAPQYMAYVQQLNKHAVACTPVTAVSHLELALAFGVVGLVCAVVSCAMLLTSTRVITNTFRLLRRIGTVGLLSFWMFAMALFGVNWLLVDMGIVPVSLSLPSAAGASQCQAPSWQLMLNPPAPVCAQPFTPSWLTITSFAATLLALLVLVLRLNTRFYSLRGSTAGQAVAGQAAAPSAGR